ncbi:RNA recognition motif domain [Dillenia turbinata]|uniref:RNA recognition motif domain n=1 Tax=Dillenia turbinata TaxID=194707 RepID=A0AAN8VAC9_9MAGN
MGRSRREKERNPNSDLSADNSNDGTAARTRPYSYEEIMMRRKNKKLPGDVEGPGEAVNVLQNDSKNTASDVPEPERSHRTEKNSVRGAKKHLVEEHEKGISREEKKSVTGGNSVKGKEEEELHDSERKLKAKPSKDQNNRSHKDSVSDVENHISEELSKNISRGSERKISSKEDDRARGKDEETRDLRSKLKSNLEKYPKKKAEGPKDDKRVDDVGKHDERSRKDSKISSDQKGDERSRKDSKYNSDRKHSRDSVGKDRYGHIKALSETEGKRKQRNEVDEKYRSRDSLKKHNSGSQDHLKELKTKRRRSRSHEHEDRGRRSPSLSPRGHKRSSNQGREHSDWSGRLQSDSDSKRVSSNGIKSNSRRHSGSKSGLGGYSPRKRRSETAIKTPSPSIRSPEKRTAGWDLPPPVSGNNQSGSVFSSLQSSLHTVAMKVQDFPSTIPTATTIARSLSGISSNILPLKSNAAIDTVQLTQATRPMRRLYVENLPASASEKALLELFNDFLVSSGVNHIQGTKPCISCIIHKEKGQAVVEFLTPEDASAALSFDGRSFSGSNIKIRRPKDFLEVATVPIFMQTGAAEKPVVAVDEISDVVLDSPHKIFVGGISKALSSKMLMDIASVFGPLKAFHFQICEDPEEPCAFLEPAVSLLQYIDQSVTLKACAGLNGMKLGGQVLTVVQAFPEAKLEDKSGSPPFYGIPEHAKPLLMKPSQILNLKNVFNLEDLAASSEANIEEVLEDIRLECARFGTIKSVNLVKQQDVTTSLDARKVGKVDKSMESVIVQLDLGFVQINTEGEMTSKNNGHDSVENGRIEPSGNIGGTDDAFQDKSPFVHMKDEQREIGDLNNEIAVEDSSSVDNSISPSQKLHGHKNVKESLEITDSEGSNAVQTTECSDEDRLVAKETKLGKPKEELKFEEANREVIWEEAKIEPAEEVAELENSMGMAIDSTLKINDKEEDFNLNDVFEPGSVLVEYARTEASCMAAHCLYGRLFDDRVIQVEYVNYDLYKGRFP